MAHLIAIGVDLHAKRGIMESATYYNCIETAKLLLDADVNPNEKDDETYALLTTAVRDNRPDILELLLSRGADPNLKGEDVPLNMAVKKPVILKQLIAGGAKVSLYQGLIEHTVYYNALDSLLILLETGVPVDERYYNIQTGVATAIRGNRIECLSYLLSHGADPNEPGDDLPIIRAARFIDPGRLRLLLDAGADVNKQHDGRAALMEACEWNNMVDVKMLLEKGASVDLADSGGNTALDIAAAKGHDEIVMLLLDGIA
jgi:ankyrin repeat protein